MRSYQYKSLSQYSPDFRTPLVRRAQNEIFRKCFLSSWVSPFLYASILYSTPLYRRFPTESLGIGLMLGLIWVMTLVLGGAIKGKSTVLPTWKRLGLEAGLHLMPLMWGLFCSWILVKYSLSWTSFFVTLVTLALAAGQILLLAPHITYLFWGTILLIGPPLITCFVQIPGQQGMAIGLFFLFYGGFVWTIGRKQNAQYWERMLSSTRTKAIIDALPGTLAWYNSERQPLGNNKNHSLVWGDETPKVFSDMVDEVITSDRKVTHTKEISGKTFYLVGKKYNFGTEALLMGIDVSTQHHFQSELHRGRELILHEVRRVQVGRIVDFLALHQIPDNKILKKLSRAEKMEPSGSSQASQVVEDLREIFASYCDLKNVLFEIEVREDFQFEGQTSEILLGLCCLVINALEAGVGQESPYLGLRSEVVNGEGRIVVTDEGEGVDEVYEQVLFEPFVSAKHGHLGLGLSLAEDIALHNNGNIVFNRKPNGSEFQFHIPLAG